jgi:chaperonin GroEL (HSP60 family)
VLADPLFWIVSNAGYDGQAVVDQVRAMPDGHGLTALTGSFGDLIESGVIDPVRVTRLSLQHAASVAALMLTTEALVLRSSWASGSDHRAGLRRPGRGDGAPVIAGVSLAAARAS